MSDVWSYYKEIANKLGSDGKGGQTSFSVEWIYKYYEDNPAKLDGIIDAFINHRNMPDVPDVPAETLDIENFCVEEGPNNDQLVAIRNALTKSVSFVQGPPGTGKSRTILNMMSCIVNGLGRNVVMVSSNNAAVGVIAEKIEGYSQNDTSVSANTINNRLRLKEQFAQLGNQSKLRQYNKTHNDFRFKFEKDAVYGVSVSNNVSFSDFSMYHSAITSTLHSMKKLFSEGPGLKYDYVIIDECSQVSTLLGIIALTSGHHVVLVGDEQQLPPIIKMEQTDPITTCFNGRVHKDMLIVRDANGNPPSFLDMSLKVFLKPSLSNKVLLRDHYRCHPGIVEFSNRNVYDGKLNIRTGRVDTSDIKVPIKVLWYQGDYCEQVDLGKDDYIDTSKRNGKQVKIFVDEELPILIRRLQSDSTLESFSVLSPFRGVLWELGEAVYAKLCQYGIDDVYTVAINNTKTIQSPEDENGDDDGAERDAVQILSVYKSQGREYDLVYFLPAEDYNWERPWSQGKNLINVATTRPKEELRIIVSTSLMSENMQKALLGSQRVIADANATKENFRFVKKLIDYAKLANESKLEYAADKATWDPNGIYDTLNLSGAAFDFPKSNWTGFTDFGFYESRTKSIFDAVPAIRRDAREIAEKKEAYLQCVIQTIVSLPQFASRKLNVYTNVMLCDIVDAAGNVLLGREEIWDKLEENGYVVPQHLRNWRRHLELHVDVVICDADRNILMFIEVDSSFHRFNEDFIAFDRQVMRDKAKDALIEEYFGSIPFIRLKTDGTGTNEKNMIDNALSTPFVSGKYCLAKSISKINRADATKLKNEWTKAGLLTEGHLWVIKKDGESWMAEPSNKTYSMPTIDGEAAGIVRHYGYNEKAGSVYFNPEYLGRFIDDYEHGRI